eukprot:3238335-Rhodomonas_salina.2
MAAGAADEQEHSVASLRPLAHKIVGGGWARNGIIGKGTAPVRAPRSERTAQADALGPINSLI